MALASLGISFGDVIVPQSNANGEAATVEITITNNGAEAINETADLNLFSSVDDVRVSQSDFIRDYLQTSEAVTLDLAPGASTTITLDYGQVVNASPGSFYLIAELAEAGSDSSATPGVVAEAEHVSRPGTNVVIDWASAFLNATQVGQTLETAPPYQARNMGIVFPAIFDAINLIESVDNPQFSSIFVDSLPEGFSADIASAEAAAVGAAFATLDSIYEDSLARLTSVGDAAGVTRITNVLDNLEDQFDRSIQELIDGGVSQEAIDAGLAIGEFVGNEILGDRADDGAAEAQGLAPLFEGENLNEIAEDDPRYIWRPVPDSPLGFFGLLPGWNGVTPFAIDSVEEFLPDGYPDFGSEEYAQEIEEIRRIGGAEDTALTTIERTADQEELVFFWLVDDPDTERPPGQWLRIGQEVSVAEDQSLIDTARTLALLGVAEANAGIIAWTAKWFPGAGEQAPQPRPVTVINHIAGSDGSDLTVQDPDWRSFDDTPPFPDYVSGHATFGGASYAVLESIFGENYQFSTITQELDGVTRSFSSFAEAARENTESRFFAGVHVRSAGIEGETAGFASAQVILDTLAAPLASEPTFGTPGDDTLDIGVDFDGIADLIFVGGGNDVVDTAATSTPAQGSNRVYGGSGADEVLVGNSDTVNGGTGDDTLDSTVGTGGNRLYGGLGGDEILVGSGDRAFGGIGSDTIDASESLGGSRLYGGAGNDQFFLGAGDRVVGGEGDDAIFVGDGGENLITGGLGADAFWITSGELPLLPNTITDFVGGEDVLGVGGGLTFADLTIVGIDGNTTIAAPSVFDMTPEVFATLLNVDAASITEANFVFG